MLPQGFTLGKSRVIPPEQFKSDEEPVMARRVDGVIGVVDLNFLVISQRQIDLIRDVIGRQSVKKRDIKNEDSQGDMKRLLILAPDESTEHENGHDRQYRQKRMGEKPPESE